MNLTTATVAQREAITTNARDVTCIAGPGSGKTETLATRVQYLVDGGTPIEEIAVMTFTNSAAKEIASRVERKMEGRLLVPAETTPKPLGFVGTLPSFCLRIMKEHGTDFGYGDRVAVISPESAQDLLESKARTLGCKAPMKQLLALKQKGRPPRTTRVDVAATVVASYFDDLREAGVVDYDALLHEFLEMLVGDSPAPTAQLKLYSAIRNRFTHLFIDEAQDSAPIDWKIYRALPIDNKLFVADGDQAIYEFRGGAVAELVAHAKSPETHLIKLEENFRSRSEICECAQRLIDHNGGRIPKATVSVSGPGGHVMLMPQSANEGEEIGQVARAIKELHGEPSVAILCRTNAIADGFRRTLPHAGVPVVEMKRSELPRDWNLARSFIELLADPENDALAFFHLIALYEKKGANAKEARDMAHSVRRAATAAGKTLNKANLHIGRITRPESALMALADQPVSREAQAIVAERYQELPLGATMLDLALAMAEVREHVKEGEGEGVHVLTMHGAKGREFDVVFLCGIEDECCPGRAGKILDEAEMTAAVEEERRLLYVGVTRARKDIIITHAASRVAVFGPHREIQPRTPHRFILEMEAKP